MCEGETSGSLFFPLSLSIFDLPLLLSHTPPATARPARGPGPSQSPGAGNSVFQGRVGPLAGRVAGMRRAGQGRGETGQGLFSHLEMEEQEECCPQEREVPWSSQLSPQLQAGTSASLLL